MSIVHLRGVLYVLQIPPPKFELEVEVEFEGEVAVELSWVKVKLTWGKVS